MAKMTDRNGNVYSNSNFFYIIYKYFKIIKRQTEDFFLVCSDMQL